MQQSTISSAITVNFVGFYLQLKNNNSQCEIWKIIATKYYFFHNISIVSDFFEFCRDLPVGSSWFWTFQAPGIVPGAWTVPRIACNKNKILVLAFYINVL